MSRLLSISIDVTKLDKTRFYQGKNGAKYASLDVWIEDNEDQYGNHASVTERQSKDERDAGTKKNYVGNGKKIYGWGENTAPRQAAPVVENDPTDDLPF